MLTDAMSWRILGRCVEGQPFAVSGVDVWELRSESLGNDPSREPRRPGLDFAAGETSANVWMFRVHEETAVRQPGYT
jgi:hypothetical protein